MMDRWQLSETASRPSQEAKIKGGLIMYKHINPELKKAIIDWYFENIDTFNRIVNCYSAFYSYIYNPDGNYLIGGENVRDFINELDKII